MNIEGLEKEATEFEENYTVYEVSQGEDGTEYAKKVCKVTVKEAYLAGAEPREKRIEELKQKLEQTEKDLVDYQFNYPKIKELEKENAGLKAGRPQWHDLKKDPTDLPKDKHDVWCKALDHYGEGWYDKDTNTWTLIYRGYRLHCIEAWCELPTFDKE